MKKFTNIKWLPEGASLEVIAYNEVVSENIGPVTAGFCFLFDGKDIILLEHANKERGFDIPGGHVEKGETAIEAMKRETLEEVGCTVKNVKMVGFQVIRKEKPEDKYPDLVSHMRFYAAELDEIKDIKLEVDSKGLYRMPIEHFFHYLVKEGKEELTDLFNVSLSV